MRFVLFLAVVVNSLDLFVTSVGIHWFGNREGNPLLAPVVRQSWPAFVLLKGVLVPLLIVQLYRYRRETPVLATAGMGIVTIALTAALGAWLGWMAGVITVGVGHMPRF
jgi:prepilin signal peptidase PulO-like enzyme (type II secretory pathway)